MFEVGQRVVCIEDGKLHNRRHGWAPGSKPTKGQIYTVREVGLFLLPSMYVENEGVQLRLEEIQNIWPEWRKDYDVGYLACRFRPLNGARLDVFRAMLKPVPKHEKVE